MKDRARVVGLALACLVTAAFAPACAGVKSPPANGGAGNGVLPVTLGAGGSSAGGSGLPVTGAGGSGLPHPSYPGQCRNLQCQQTSCTSGPCLQTPCAPGVKTTVSGIVYDPAGKVPLYNVVVYVPNDALADIPTGATCDTCESPISGHPVAATLTNAKGEFTLEDAPVGANVPLVIQVGKWRRTVSVPSVAACADTHLADPNVTRLPRNQGEGHVPRIGVATGGSDALECLVRKIGVDEAEFTLETEPGRVNLFAGYRAAPTFRAGVTLPTSSTLFDSAAKMKGYDMLLMSCEGSDNITRSMPEHQAVQDYADAGGRIFASHYHNIWAKEGLGNWPMVATFSSGAHGFTTDIVGTIDVSFPKGMAYSEWLVNVGASATPGQLTIKGAEHTIDVATSTLAQRWIYGTDMEKNTPMVQYMTFNTPVSSIPPPDPAPVQCGRVVLSDLHVSTGTGDSGKLPFPTGCVSKDLSPQEKALEFMIFDLSSCVQKDSQPVKPPVVE
jgi:hypothetical protein